MKIYHGSKVIIEKPKYKGSDPHNDYGSAFYLTLDLLSAKTWACKDNEIGIVNEYLINNYVFKNFKILDLSNKNKYSVLNWIAILMHFRELDSDFIKDNQIALDWIKKYYIDVDEYDVVIGYRADNSYFEFPKQFISNNLAFDELENIYKLGNLGIQYAFISQKAINSLKFNKPIKCDYSFLGTYNRIVNEATTNFDTLLNKPKSPNKKYIFDLIRDNNYGQL